MPRLKCKEKDKNDSGFTLIELLLVIGILSILAVATFVSFSSVRSGAKTRSAQREVASAIKLAQSYALEGKVHGGTTPKYYGFKFRNDRRTYVICKNNSAGDAGCSADVETYTLTSGVTLNASTSIADSLIMFAIPHGNNSNAGDRTLILSDSAGSSRSVVINNRGMITED